MDKFDFSIWKRARAERRKVGEGERRSLLQEVDDALGQLSRRYQWKRAFFFGSLTQPGRFGKHSDVDIGIEGLEKLLHYRFISDISDLLDRSVDVVRLEDCPFSEAIETRGVEWKKKQ